MLWLRNKKNNFQLYSYLDAWFLRQVSYVNLISLTLVMQKVIHSIRSCTSAYVLWKLLNKLGKEIKCEALLSILLLFV